MPEDDRDDDETTGEHVNDHDRQQARQAASAYFDRERALFDAHGNRVTFQVYRANLRATNLTDLHGPELVELAVDGDEISGHDTVAAVKERLVRELDGIVQPGENVTLVFDRHPMDDDALFYADCFIALPAWIQIVIHRGSYDRVQNLYRDLADRIAARP